MSSPHSAKYVVLTAAHNEEALIEYPLSSVAKQTVPPLRYVVANDRSTDGTEDVVRRYAEHHAFIELLDLSGQGEREFSAKAQAINAAYEQVRSLSFDFVAVLDADVSFEADYYEWLFHEFAKDNRLGIAGGPQYDLSKGALVAKRNSREHSVCGPAQTFRRDCFDAISGYPRPLYGGVDAVAETTARMQGWRVRTLEGKRVIHHRTTGSHGQSELKALFRLGIENHSIGYHPLFMAARALARVLQRPPLLGTVALLAGFCWSGLRRTERQVPPEIVAFLRDEQIDRLRKRIILGRKSDR